MSNEYNQRIIKEQKRIESQIEYYQNYKDVKREIVFKEIKSTKERKENYSKDI